MNGLLFPAKREVPAATGIAEARLERGGVGSKAQSHGYGAADQVFPIVICFSCTGCFFTGPPTVQKS